MEKKSKNTLIDINYYEVLDRNKEKRYSTKYIVSCITYLKRKKKKVMFFKEQVGKTWFVKYENNFVQMPGNKELFEFIQPLVEKETTLDYNKYLHAKMKREREQYV